jgi:hypothetical protein
MRDNEQGTVMALNGFYEIGEHMTKDRVHW